jgi:hypothetical protein
MADFCQVLGRFLSVFILDTQLCFPYIPSQKKQTLYHAPSYFLAKQKNVKDQMF